MDLFHGPFLMGKCDFPTRGIFFKLLYLLENFFQSDIFDISCQSGRRCLENGIKNGDIFSIFIHHEPSSAERN